MRTWVLVDTKNVLSRMFYALDTLLWKGERVEALYGLVREVHILSARLRIPLSNFVFFFDSQNHDYRRTFVPGYKVRNKGDYLSGTTKEKKFLTEQVSLTMRALETHAGYKPLLKRGFEADDLIAACSKKLDPETERAFVISNDSDLLQLLRKNVRLFNHRTGDTITAKQFTKDWGIHPKWWACVKALAGCSGDGVKGMTGVAELTASRYFKDPKLVREGLRGQIFDYMQSEEYKNNLKVVKLPIWGTPTFILRKVESPDWRAMCKAYGFDYKRISLVKGD